MQRGDTEPSAEEAKQFATDIPKVPGITPGNTIGGKYVGSSLLIITAIVGSFGY